MTRRIQASLGTLLFCGLAPPALAAEVNVGSGSSFDLDTGSLDLGCADLTVGGTFSAGTVGVAAARDVTIDPSGLVNGDSATLEVAGDWDNAGSFDPGTSTVNLVDGCGLSSATVAGDSTFANLDLTSATGKLFQFESGSTQTVTQSLAISGAPGDVLKIRATLDGSEAFLDSQGTQAASYVEVKDNHAIGNPIHLDLGSAVLGNALGWIFDVPALPAAGLALLAAALVWSARSGLVSRQGEEPM